MLNVQSLIDAGVPALVDLCGTDSRFYQLVNSFQARAISYGRWWGTTRLLEFCIQDSNVCSTPQGACLVMPREVAVIEALTLNGAPLQPRNSWYSYVTPVDYNNGCGNNQCQSLYPYADWLRGPWGVSEDKLTVPSYQVTSTGQTIRFFFNPADVGKKIRVQGYDENNVWVRSTIDGTVQDGEQVTFALTGGEAYTDTTTVWRAGSPQAIIKEVTSYNVQMFAINDDDTVGQSLANYQPTETTPSYRKFFIPGSICGCGTAYASLRCIVSLRHIPVTTASDWLLFDEALPAYEDGVQAARYWRDGNKQLGDAYFFGLPTPARNRRGVLNVSIGSGAIPTLQATLRKNTADLTTVQVRRSGVNLAGFV